MNAQVPRRPESALDILELEISEVMARKMMVLGTKQQPQSEFK